MTPARSVIAARSQRSPVRKSTAGTATTAVSASGRMSGGDAVRTVSPAVRATDVAR